MSTDTPRLSIVIVSRNGWSDLSRCLVSLRDLPGSPDREVIVVDNGSDDGTPDRVERDFPGFRLLRNRDNRGYPAANNQGAAAARGEFLLFLNPDTAVPSGALEWMLDELIRNPGLGGVGPALVDAGGGFQVSFGGRVTFWRELARKAVLNARLRRRIGGWRRSRPADWLSGACLMVRREALPFPRPFDEGYFLYFEDIDLCYRMREKGWKLAFLPEVRVFHKGGGSTGSRPLFSRYHYRRSQLRFYRRHNSFPARVLLKFYLAVVFVGMYLKRPNKRSEPHFERKRFFSLLGRGGTE